jgi:hypothetical protein
LREVEFLPEWYPRIKRRKRAVMIQSWLALAVVVMFLGMALDKRWQVHRAKAAAIECSDQINDSQKQLAQLNQKLQYEAQLRRQEQIMAALGLNVDATRLMNVLEEAMPKQMALTALTFETQEVMCPAANPSGLETAPMDRRLKVRMDGVCPTDVELATLLGKLSAVKFFDDVAMSYARDGLKDGHVTREFEVSFSMNLNAPVDNPVGVALAEGK